jgi:hypothetical protein
MASRARPPLRNPSTPGRARALPYRVTLDQRGVTGQPALGRRSSDEVTPPIERPLQQGRASVRASQLCVPEGAARGHKAAAGTVLVPRTC